MTPWLVESVRSCTLWLVLAFNVKSSLLLQFFLHLTFTTSFIFIILPSSFLSLLKTDIKSYFVQYKAYIPYEETQGILKRLKTSISFTILTHGTVYFACTSRFFAF